MSKTGPEESKLVSEQTRSKSDETKEERIANKQNQTNIITAGISSITTLVVGLVVAFFGFPPFQDWVQSLGGDSTHKLKILAIEQIPHEVFAYAGNDIKDGGKGTFSIIYDDDKVPNYKLEYFLPGDKYGYAALAFKFPKAQDFSDFRAIECTIIFNQADDKIELYAKDISNNSSTILVVPDRGSKEMVLHYEFTNFSNVVFTAIQEFGIIASTDYSTGSHEVRIKYLRLVK